MIRIIADEKIPFLKGILEPYADMVYLPGNKITNDAVQGADALIIRTRTTCDQTLLEGTFVKFIATATIGFDHIDAEYCNTNNIQWVSAPGCNSSSVQQYIIAALLSIAQNHKFVLSDLTLGIIGVGNVGSKVLAAANFLGMKVKLNDPPRARKEGNSGFVSLEDILDTCDIITLHVPLNKGGTDNTFHLFNGDLLNKMKSGAWLINSSRGEVIETKALKEVLKAGKINGAVLDVWENEPSPDTELLRQVYISTPHIAGYSTDGKANGTAQVIHSLSEFFGLPLRDFYPSALPLPLNPEIMIDGDGKSSFQIVNEAIIHSYPIMQDHLRLQLSPETFEQQRGNYPVRREFPAHTVRLLNCKPEVWKLLSNLGFCVLPG